MQRAHHLRSVHALVANSCVEVGIDPIFRGKSQRRRSTEEQSNAQASELHGCSFGLDVRSLSRFKGSARFCWVQHLGEPKVNLENPAEPSRTLQNPVEP